MKRRKEPRLFPVVQYPLKVFRGRIIHSLGPLQVEDINDGALVVGSNGKIISYGSFKEVACEFLHGKKAKLINLTGMLLIPGLIDCHTHLPQLDQRGKHGATLIEWLEKYIFPAEASFRDLKIVDDVAKRFFKKMILNGTTTAVIYSTIHAKATDHIFEIAKNAGVRAIIGKVMMDRNSPPLLHEETMTSIRESEALCAKWHGTGGGRLYYAYSPRFAPTCSKKLLKEIGRLIHESGAYFQTHIAETLDENTRVKIMYPEYSGSVSLLEATGCLGYKSLLGHAIYISPGECKLLSQTGTKLIHCPTSNFFLKSGRMPIEMIEAAGITYGLGTDIGAGTSMSLFTVMRHADYIQPFLSAPPIKTFYLATLGGAQALSLDHEIGNFQPGKSADFCAVDILRIDPRYKLSELATNEVLSLLAYRGDGRVIDSTYVSGQKLDVDAEGLKVKGEKVVRRGTPAREYL